MEPDCDFYQIDFTTISDWEVFIAQIEEIFCKWNLSNNNCNDKSNDECDCNKGTWSIKSEDIVFKTVKFVLSCYHLNAENPSAFKYNSEGKNNHFKIKVLEDMMNVENDFKSVNCLEDSVDCLIRWYGLTDFLVLIPDKCVTISSESKVKLILSSLSIAVTNIKCELPIFVKVLETWQNYFVGVCISKGVRSDYQMIHLKKIPSHCKHLAGLLGVFKSKVAPSLIFLDPVLVSARFSYILQDWDNFAYFDEPLDLKFVDNNIDISILKSLPFGTTCEPINSLTLHAIWPELLENIVVDSETYTDLEPTSAPVWSLSTCVVKEPNCLLSTYVEEYLEKCCCKHLMKDLMGDICKRNNQTDPNLRKSLNRLTQTELPGISKLIKGVNDITKSKSFRDPISEDILMVILYFLFPDANEDTQEPYITDGISEHKYPYNLQNMKSCPVDGLIWRLSLLMAHVMYMPRGINAMAHLWYEFIQELYFRCENGILIPGIEQKNPEYRTCLLNQKLQLLNCCIKRKIVREKPDKNENNLYKDDNSEDEEFYDCQTVSNKSTEDNLKIKYRHSLWNQPVGRFHKCNNMRLITTGEYMYEPLTQELIPKTEDQLEEDVAVLLQLGSDSYGSELRSKLMSASLCSDMESFKAANPGAILEDFIRWYSPRDWIEEDEIDEYGHKKGHLSARMMLPGNIWKEVWDVSTPVPAARQKRLFDDTQEARKVLSYLDSLNPAEIFRLLLPTVIHIALVTVIEQFVQFPLIYLETKIQELVKKAVSITQSSDFDLISCQELASDIAMIESVISQYKSLKYKLFPDNCHFPNEDSFIKQLIDGFDVIVPFGSKGELGNRIFIIFSQEKKSDKFLIDEIEETTEDEIDQTDPYSVFPSPFQKEFILRVRAPRPSSTSRILPQKMVVKVFKDQIIMAGCYSQDIIFI